MQLLAATTLSCASGEDPAGPGACDDAGCAVTELCNGIDDDGDGLVDRLANGAPLEEVCDSLCGPGTRTCVGGALTPCSAREPSDEVCDGVDNDCDAFFDETCACRAGDTRPCGGDADGTCGRGVQRCVDGEWSPCAGEPERGDEVCDGVDNDCNGQIDEGCGCEPGQEQPCGEDAGACAPGVQRCGDGGRWGPCEGGARARDEVCNGLDDDCDGATDEAWSEDVYEDNDNAGAASRLPTITENGDPIFWAASLFPVGDHDWYALRATERGGSWCVPGLGEDDYQLTIALVIPPGAEPGSYQVCVGGEGRTSCTQTVDFDPGAREYRLVWCWDGRCGADDARDFQIEVKADEDFAQACGDYSLRAEVVRPGTGCP